MSWSIDGKTVFVTGAARGIGAESARRLHAKGANVALVGLEPELLEQLAGELGDRAAAFEADVTDADALERAVDGAVEAFGGIDVAIANAGINMSGTIAKGRVDAIERVLEVNLMGVWRTDRAVLPQIVERKGYLLNIASLAAVSHAPMMGPYATAKAGVEALSDCLRQELALTGARVGCAYFGFIDTDLVRAGFEEPSAQVMRKEMPSFLTKTAPLPVAIDAIERGVERRKARVWAPRFVGPALALRGILQPLTERRAMKSKHLPEALRLADPEHGGGERDDPVLGTSAAGR
jgi:NAD(P)-dependent dehydrogenase (short-subunit alcohol dehydrogenase family)